MKKEAVQNDDTDDSTDTQPIHGEPGHDGFQHMQNTYPVDDTLPIDDTLPSFQHMRNTYPVDDTLPIDDTLPMEYEFETQKIDFEDQTRQAFNLFDDTEVIDEYNSEAPANDECEKSDNTEILSDTQVLSDDEFMRSAGAYLVDPGNSPNSGCKDHSDDDGQKQSDVISRGEQHSGSMLGGFTCIRTASIRASGLAARNAALERTKSNSGSTRNVNLPQVQISGKDGESVNKDSFKLDKELKECHEDYDRQVNESSYENVPMGGSKTVRKLFAEDIVSDGGESEGGVKNCGRDESPSSFAFENDLGGLSYINSQEPGELSQANALDVVSKFLELNDIVGDEDVTVKGFSGKKLALASEARGAQSLAKKATSTNAKPVAFKWDDNVEDEGGGEFFKKKKELFFGNGNQKKKTSTSRYLKSKSSLAVEKVRTKEKPASKRKLKALALSDSKLLSENLGRNHKSSDFLETNKKSLIDDLNEDMRNNSREGQVGNETDNNLLDVGFDTQLAADAMEELHFGVDLNCNDATNNNEGTKKVRDELDKGQNLDKNFYIKGTCPGVRTRESKKTRNAVEKVGIKEKPVRKRKLKALALSDSNLLSENLGRNHNSSDFLESNKKSLTDDLNEDTRNNSREGQVGNEPDNNLPDVGFDTQLAADAMEELHFGVDLSCNDTTNNNEGTKKVRDELDEGQNMVKNYRKGTCSGAGALVRTRESKKTRNSVQCSSRLSNCSAKEWENVNKQLDGPLVGRKPVRAQVGSRGNDRNKIKKLSTGLKMTGQRGEDGFDASDALDQPAETDKISFQQCPMQEQLDSPSPIARRTRGSLQTCHVKCGKDLNSSKEISDATMKRNKEKTKAVASATSVDESNFCDLSDKDYMPGNASFRELNQLNPRILNYPKKKRTRSQVRSGQDASTDCNARSKRSKMDVTNSSKINESSEQNSSASGAKRKTPSDRKSGSVIPNDVIQIKVRNQSKVNTDGECNGTSPEDRCKLSATASKTPVSCSTSVDDASPICKGDEYRRQSCRKNLARSALMKELSSLSPSGTEIMSPAKDSRKRRDMANVRVLFSRHMDADIVKLQKKILTRLGASEASSMSDASHFVTEKFVRTKNMLEAIAFGKPVMTHLWLESCGQASCFIDERNYILRDTKKEKEFGFSMPASLARASQHPLLLGQKVLITPNTKPGKEILVNLVKAVRGSVVDRLGRSSLKDMFPDDILVLSCEEDYDICLPFLEKGAAVYSSELLLNGIVTQRLQFERHRLFADKVKKTRSTVWLKKDEEHLPVTKGK